MLELHIPQALSITFWDSYLVWACLKIHGAKNKWNIFRVLECIGSVPKFQDILIDTSQSSSVDQRPLEACTTRTTCWAFDGCQVWPCLTAIPMAPRARLHSGNGGSGLQRRGCTVQQLCVALIRIFGLSLYSCYMLVTFKYGWEGNFASDRAAKLFCSRHGLKTPTIEGGHSFIQCSFRQHTKTHTHSTLVCILYMIWYIYIYIYMLYLFTPIYPSGLFWWAGFCIALLDIPWRPCREEIEKDLLRTFPGHPCEAALATSSRDILRMLCCARNVSCFHLMGFMMLFALR